MTLWDYTARTFLIFAALLQFGLGCLSAYEHALWQTFLGVGATLLWAYNFQSVLRWPDQRAELAEAERELADVLAMTCYPPGFYVEVTPEQFDKIKRGAEDVRRALNEGWS